jgi:hypothetical protein
MENGWAGWLALILAPGLAFIGLLAGKAMERRTAKGTTALAMIDTLGQRLAAADRRAQLMEDYALDLRAALIAAGLDVPDWPDERAVRQ